MDDSMTAEPKFLVHQATHLFMTDPIHFQVIQMNNSAFIWVGKADGKLGDMSVAVPPFGTLVRYWIILWLLPFANQSALEQRNASATTIINRGVSENGRDLARRLGKSNTYCQNSRFINSPAVAIYMTASKYKQQFYISFDLNSPDDMLFVFVEKKLTELLKNIL